MIPVFKPLIEKEEIAASTNALKIGWLGMGKFVGEFEEKMKVFIDAPDRYFAAVSTASAALHLGLLVAGVGPGDEVITPSFNNVADFQMIQATGASIVFCDIDDNTLCIDLQKAEKLITKKTKAIIVMDYDCVLCDHDAIKKLAHKYGLRIIHDAAHSIGSKYKGHMIGSFSDICVFSFDPVKTMTCLDGGMLIVKSKRELQKIQEMRLIGMGQSPKLMYQNKRAWTYDVRYQGYRYHMSNVHAAIGLAQLAKMHRITKHRQYACRFYNDTLKHITEVTTPKTDFTDITPFLYYIRVPANKRDALRAHMEKDGIDTGIHWQPGHWFTLFHSCKRGDLSVTESVGHEILSLPLHSDISEKNLTRITRSIDAFFRR